MTDMQYYEMMGYPSCSPIASYPAASLESMYPDIYNRIHPRVRHMCMMMDTPNNAEMYPCPRRQTVERMTDDIYMQMMSEMGREYGNWDPMYQQYPEYGGGFSGGSFLRDIISIILIRELLFRRGHRF